MTARKELEALLRSQIWDLEENPWGAREALFLKVDPSALRVYADVLLDEDLPKGGAFRKVTTMRVNKIQEVASALDTLRSGATLTEAMKKSLYVAFTNEYGAHGVAAWTYTRLVFGSPFGFPFELSYETKHREDPVPLLVAKAREILLSGPDSAFLSSLGLQFAGYPRTARHVSLPYGMASPMSWVSDDCITGNEYLGPTGLYSEGHPESREIPRPAPPLLKFLMSPEAQQICKLYLETPSLGSCDFQGISGGAGVKKLFLRTRVLSYEALGKIGDFFPSLRVVLIQTQGNSGRFMPPPLDELRGAFTGPRFRHLTHLGMPMPLGFEEDILDLFSKMELPKLKWLFLLHYSRDLEFTKALAGLPQMKKVQIEVSPSRYPIDSFLTERTKKILETYRTDKM